MNNVEKLSPFHSVKKKKAWDFIYRVIVIGFIFHAALCMSVIENKLPKQSSCWIKNCGKSVTWGLVCCIPYLQDSY